jgi:hypothetical protein
MACHLPPPLFSRYPSKAPQIFLKAFQIFTGKTLRWDDAHRSRRSPFPSTQPEFGWLQRIRMTQKVAIAKDCFGSNSGELLNASNVRNQCKCSSRTSTIYWVLTLGHDADPGHDHFSVFRFVRVAGPYFAGSSLILSPHTTPLIMRASPCPLRPLTNWSRNPRQRSRLRRLVWPSADAAKGRRSRRPLGLSAEPCVKAVLAFCHVE